MTGAELGGDLALAYQGMTRAWRDRLIGVGADPGIVVSLIGIMPAQVEGRLWQPLDGAPDAIIVPVFIDDIMSPETAEPELAPLFGDLIDLVAFNVAAPERWALRIGAAEWLGAYGPQLLDPEPVDVHCHPWAWVCARGTGIVPLTDRAADLRRLLSPCRSLAVADANYGLELKGALAMPFPIPRIFVRRAVKVAA